MNLAPTPTMNEKISSPRRLRSAASSRRSLLAAALIAGLAAPACGSGAEGTESAATSTAALLVPISHGATPLVPLVTAAPSNAEIAATLSEFMAYPEPSSFRSSQATIGAPNEQLWGGDTLWRMSPSPLGGDSGGVWHDAVTMEMLVNYQLATHDATYQSIVEAYGNGQYNPVLPFADYGCIQGHCNWNVYNDDDLWWALAFLRARELEVSLEPTDKSPSARAALAASYLAGAQAVFQHVCSQWNSIPGGGVPQTLGGSGLNTITNELFFQTAMKLYLAAPGATNVCSTQANTSGSSYLGWAAAEYSLFKSDWWGGMTPIDVPLMADAYPTGSNPTFWTYNQGPILGALLDFANAPSADRANQSVYDSDQTILAYGYGIVTAVIAPNGYLAPKGILTETNMSDDACVNAGTGPGDCPAFKGILMRYLARFVNGAQRGDPSYALSYTAAADGFIAANAAAIFAYEDDYVSEDWSSYGPYPAAAQNIAGAGTFDANPWSTQTIETAGMDGLIASVGLLVPPPPPTLGITSVSETSGYTGDTLAITGSLFATAPGATTFNLVPVSPGPLPVFLPARNVSCSTASSCTMTVPPGAGTYSIVVNVNSASAVAPKSFTYEAPFVSAVTPASGSTLGESAVYISGRGLDDSMTVYFGATALAGTAQCAGNTQCGVLSPPGNAGVVDVVVNSGGLTSAKTAADKFTYVYAPSATAVSVRGGALWTSENTTGTVNLNEAAPAGGTVVTLTATDPSGAGQPTGVTIPATITVPAGATAVNFPISVAATALAGVTFTASLNGSSLSALSRIFTGQIALSFDYPGDGALLRAGQATTFSIWVRHSPSLAPGVAATISNTNPGDLALPASVAIPYEGGSANGAAASFTGTCEGSPVAGATAVVTVTYGTVSESVTVDMAAALHAPPLCRPGLPCNPI